jgi:hypothetical protein
MNEAETGVVEGSRILREYPMTLGRLEGHGRRGKALTADYVLVYRNHKLAVVEAKAWDEELTEGVAQAKNYAGKLGVRYTYSTNGQGIYGIDMRAGTEGEAPGYPTPEELWSLTFAEEDAWRDRFAAVPFEDKGGYFQARYYQDIAIERTLDAICAAQDRILLTLATGTGKTFIAFQIAWKLFHSRWNLSREPSRRPRILFLADRNILADQATRDFSAFPEDAMVRIRPEDIRKKGKAPKNGSLFFTIFQTFMSGPPKEGGGKTGTGTNFATAAKFEPVPVFRRATRPHRHAEAQRQRGHLRLFRRPGRQEPRGNGSLARPKNASRRGNHAVRTERRRGVVRPLPGRDGVDQPGRETRARASEAGPGEVDAPGQRAGIAARTRRRGDRLINSRRAPASPRRCRPSLPAAPPAPPHRSPLLRWARRPLSRTRFAGRPGSAPGPAGRPGSAPAAA